MDAEQMIDALGRMPNVTLRAASEYQSHMDEMVSAVDRALLENPRIEELIGGNPVQVMKDNHRNHAAFMGVVFTLGSSELLVRTVIWVYRAYRAHGFTYDYFPSALNAWIHAIEQHLTAECAASIVEIYRWMIAEHTGFIELSQAETGDPPPIRADWQTRKEAFLNALLKGETQSCLRMAESVGKDTMSLEQFYLHAVQPAMYDVGRLWEQAKITVADEHLASAIVGRVMASAAVRCPRASFVRGRALVTSSANEFHEIGAWMVSDILEQDGWEIHYLGADTPIDALVQAASAFKPDLLAISVTISFNLRAAREAIEAFRAAPALKSVHILVGGRAFMEAGDLWREIGADAFSENAAAARESARRWSAEGASHAVT